MRGAVAVTVIIAGFAWERAFHRTQALGDFVGSRAVLGLNKPAFHHDLMSSFGAGGRAGKAISSDDLNPHLLVVEHVRIR